ncbi:CobW family GTP-binding protein [Thermocrinis sp.]
MLPAFVITGFLGSGKTTLLINSAKDYFKNKRVAVVVNEFGEVGVDGKVLQNVYSQVMELSEGCICCSLHGEFEKAIGEIRGKYNPDVLLVETSGSAEPFPVAFTLKSLGFFLEAILCVVDAKNFEKYKNEPTALYQLGGSNVVVINKIDLISEQELRALEEEIKKLWDAYVVRDAFTGEKLFKDLVIYKTSYSKLPEEVFAGSYGLSEILSLVKEPPHSHHSYAQKVQYYKEPVDYEELKSIFDNLPKSVIRAKGIVRLRYSPYPVFVNYSFGSFEVGDELPDYKGESFIVFISKNSLRLL